MSRLGLDGAGSTRNRKTGSEGCGSLGRRDVTVLVDAVAHRPKSISSKATDTQKGKMVENNYIETLPRARLPLYPASMIA